MKFNKNLIIIILVVFVIGLGLGYLAGGKVVPSSSISPSFFLVNPAANQELFQEVWQIAKTYYVKQPVSDEDLFYGSLRGIVSALKDPYSIFLDPKVANKFKEEISGSFEGIGIEIGIKKNQLTVVAPLPETPAAKAGLKAGDKILAVNGVDTSEMSVDYAATLIRGKRGTVVKLTVWRQGWDKSKDLEIMRAKIVIKTVEWEMKNNQVAYLKISHFNNDTYKNLSRVVKEIISQNTSKLILDLRNNPGGYLDVAVDVAGFWLPEKVIVVSKDAKNEVNTFKANGQGDLSKMKLIVLINNGSASAAEILAGALQDYQKATLIGETTFGKGSVQELIDLPGGSAIKVTTAYWYTPKDRQINEKGIEPDLKIEMTDEDYNNDRDPQLTRALELLK